jgi:competence protein ComEC
VRPLFAATLALLTVSVAVVSQSNLRFAMCWTIAGILAIALAPPARGQRRIYNAAAGIIGCLLIFFHPLVVTPPLTSLPNSVTGEICSPIRKGPSSDRFTLCAPDGKYAVRTNSKLALNYLDRVRVTSEFTEPEPPRNIGEFDYAEWCRLHHIRAISSSNADVQLIDAGQNVIGRFVSAVRTWIDTRCKAGLPNDTAALASGILLSITDDLPYELQEAFGRTGTVHVLSTSGMHISVLVASIGTIMVWSGRFATAAAGLGLSLLIGYASGGGPAPLRAVTSLFARLVARVLVRAPEPWHVLCLCGCIAILRDPFVVMDAGAQLSFLAVSGLIVASPVADVLSLRIRQSPALLTKVLLTLIQGVIVSFIVTLITSPAVAFHMHHISLISPIANIPVGFLSEWALLIGALSVLCGGIPGVGPVLFTLLHGVLRSLIYVANLLADIPYADIATGMADPSAVTLATVSLIASCYVVGNKFVRNAAVNEPQYYIPWSPTKPSM